MNFKKNKYPIKVIDGIEIPMLDGIKLSAKLWIPETANAENPVPVVLEYIPYRKRDSYAFRDYKLHTYTASHGYACIRVDIRGCGDSAGQFIDEYTPQEQQDAINVIEWLSQQQWSNGNVGMVGLSWGANASMYSATFNPPALKAIIPVGGTTDKYYDDGGYYVGGYPGEGVGWGGVMFGYAARPADPALVGDSWRDDWLQRLETLPLLIKTWLQHQLRDDYWITGSPIEALDKIKIPVLGVSGWYDCWPNTVLHLAKDLKSNHAKVISSACGHVYPCIGSPGPKYNFLGIACQWWDKWLKGIDNGIENMPAVTAYIMDSHKPTAQPTNRPGRWVSESLWPSKNINTAKYYICGNTLATQQNNDSQLQMIKSPLTTGLASGEYMPCSSSSAELPHDQRPDDAKSVCYDTSVLNEDLEILGTPYMKLKIRCDNPTALVAVRICDVAPDGASTLVSFGILNLALREGKQTNAPITVGKDYNVTVKLNDTGYRIKAGNKMRLAISSNYWPMAWPVRHATTLHITPADCVLELPKRTASPESELCEWIDVADCGCELPHEVIESGWDKRKIIADIQNAITEYSVGYDKGTLYIKDTDTLYNEGSTQNYRIGEDDPLSAEIEYSYKFELKRNDWHIKCLSKLLLSCDADYFIIDAQLDAYENDKIIKTRKWNEKIPRSVY